MPLPIVSVCHWLRQCRFGSPARITAETTFETLAKPVAHRNETLGGAALRLARLARVEPTHYSCRRASIGSSRAAARAGYMPKITPMPTEMLKANGRLQSAIWGCISENILAMSDVP